MKTLNNIFAIFYLIFFIGWFTLIFSYSSVVDGIFPGELIGLGFLISGLIHWKLSNNLSGVFRENFFVFVSCLNIITVFIIALIFGFIRGESGMMVLPFLSLLGIFSLFTLLLGITSILKTSKKFIFWVFFPVVIILLFLFAESYIKSKISPFEYSDHTPPLILK